MVSIISRWLQKRMPSFETIESKLTKEEIENNKDITNNLKLNISWFFILILIYYLFLDIKAFLVSYTALIGLFFSIVSIFLSILLSRQYIVLKYKIYMFMLGFSLGGAMLLGNSLTLFMVNNMELSIVLLFITILCIKKIIFSSVMKSTKYEWLLNFGSFFALLTSIWEFFFGKGNFEEFIEAIFITIFLSVLYKIALNAFEDHYKTLFYLFTYPEEFRKKFDYSVKDWYGIHSPQYKAEKKS